MIISDISDAPPAIRAVSRALLGVLGLFDGPCWIAGGALRDPLAGYLTSKDVDVFFPTREAFDAAASRLKKNGAKVVKETAFATSFETSHGLVDLVSARFGATPAETIDCFDFVACCAAITTTEYVRHALFENDAVARILRVHELSTKQSVERMNRLAARGWSMTGEEKAALEAACAAMPEGEGYDVTSVSIARADLDPYAQATPDPALARTDDVIIDF